MNDGYIGIQKTMQKEKDINLYIKQEEQIAIK